MNKPGLQAGSSDNCPLVHVTVAKELSSRENPELHVTLKLSPDLYVH